LKQANRFEVYFNTLTGKLICYFLQKHKEEFTVLAISISTVLLNLASKLFETFVWLRLCCTSKTVVIFGKSRGQKGRIEFGYLFSVETLQTLQINQTAWINAQNSGYGLTVHA